MGFATVSLFCTVALLGAAVITLISAVVRGLRPAPAGPDPVEDPQAAHGARRHAALGASLAAVAAVACFVVALPLLVQHVGGIARGVAWGLVPSGAGLVLVAVLALTEVTWPAPAGAVRTASLARRSVRDIAPPLLRRWLWVATALVALLTIGFGVSAAPSGRAVALSGSTPRGDVGVSTGPYPGWYFGLPLLAGALLLTAGVELVLRLIAARAVVPGVGAAWDAALRRLSAHRAVRAAQFAVALTAVGMLLFGGFALQALGDNWAAVGGAHAGVYLGAGSALMLAGGAVFVASAIVACLPGKAPR